MPVTPLHHPGRRAGRAALATLALAASAACWSDVNEEQRAGDVDSVSPFDSAAPAPAGQAIPMDTLAPPIDTAARADSLRAPTSSGTAGGGATTPPTNPPPAR